MVDESGLHDYSTGRRIPAPSVTRFLELAANDRGVPRVRAQIAHGTRNERASSLRAFAAWVITARVDIGGAWAEFGDAPAHHVTPFIIDQYIEHLIARGTSESTLNKHLAFLKRAWNYGIKARILPPGTHNPVLHTPRRRSLHERQELVQERSFTLDEVETILRSCREGVVISRLGRRAGKPYPYKTRWRPEPYLGHGIELAIETGLRRNELRELRWDAVDFDRGFLRVRHASSKSGGRVVPLSQRALDILASIPRAGLYVLVNRLKRQLPIDRLTRATKKLLKHLRIEEKTFHGSRHTFAQRAVSRGVPPHRLKEALGHSSLAITEVYLQCDMAAYAPEFRRLMGGATPPGAAGPAAPPSLPKEAGDGRG